MALPPYYTEQERNLDFLRRKIVDLKTELVHLEEEYDRSTVKYFMSLRDLHVSNIGFKVQDLEKELRALRLKFEQSL